MKQAVERLKKFLVNDSEKSEYIYKGITIAAIAVSLVLILTMLLTNRYSGTKTAPGETDFANALDSKIKSGSDKDNENRPFRHPTDITGEEGDSGDDPEAKAPDGEKPDQRSPEPVSLTLSLTDAEASELLAFAFSQRFPITDVKVSFHSPDTVIVKGNMEKEKLGEIFSEQDLPLLRAALILAPDELEGELVFSLSLDDGISLPHRAHIGKQDKPDPLCTARSR